MVYVAKTNAISISLSATMSEAGVLMARLKEIEGLIFYTLIHNGRKCRDL